MRLPLLFVLLVSVAALAYAQTEPPAPVGAPEAKPAPGEVKEPLNIGEILPERVLGEATAPVTIIEYASLTCSHCAHFHKEILPKLTEKYIATGKVKLIYRDFPLDGPALRAAALAQCMPEDRYFPFLKTLFETSANWAASPDLDTTLTQYAKLAGLPGERITACFADKKVQEALAQRRIEAEKQFQVDATPTFIFNYGVEKVSGASDFESFEKTVLKYVGKRPAKPVSTPKAARPAEKAPATDSEKK